MSDNFFKLNKGLNLVGQSSEPGTGANGDIYYNTSLNKFRKFENGSWGDLSSAASSGGVAQITYIDKTLTTKPSSAPYSPDGTAVISNDKVLFTNLGSGNNEVYKATVTGGSITWTLLALGQNLAGTPTVGDIVYIDAGTSFGNHIYAYNGTSWFDLSPMVSTGATSFTAHGVVIGNGTSVLQTTSSGAAKQALYSNGPSADPTYQDVSSIMKSISQSAHGFSVGNILYYTGSTYALAKADSDATSEALGFVSTVTDSNNFVLMSLGYMTGLSGLTAGTTFYLSDTSAGALTGTQPTTATHISKPMLVADSTTSGFIIQSRGVSIASGGNSGPTNTYFNGYMSSASSWSTATTSYVDPTNSGGNALTTIFSNGITVTAAASNLPGITFTPASAASVYKITAKCALGDTAVNNAGGGTYRITDGTTPFGWHFDLSRGSGTTDTLVELSGVYAPGTTSPVTVKIQILALASTAKIFSSAFDASLPSIQWEIIQIK